MGNEYKIVIGKAEGKDHLEDLGIDGRVFVWILEKQGGKLWTGFIWLKTGNSGGIS